MVYGRRRRTAPRKGAIRRILMTLGRLGHVWAHMTKVHGP